MTPDRRADTVRLADISMAELRRSLITLALLLLVLGLFVFMVWRVLIAALLGAVTAIYVRPLSRWLARRIGSDGVAASLSIAAVLVPLLAVAAYGYMEVREAARYIAENAEQVTAMIAEEISRLPLVRGNLHDPVERMIVAAGDVGTELPAGFQELLAGLTISTAIYLLTAFYLLTQSAAVVDYLRSSVPSRYAPLAENMEVNARGVLYGAVYATFLTQAIKAGLVLGLNLVLGVPLAVTLALIAFVVGLFPVLGTWVIYVPAAGWLLVFDGSPWKAAVMLCGGFGLSTVLLSMYVRPRVAAERSQILDFYWMFVGLIAGVYAFGAAGIVLGPLVIGLLKAVLDAIRAPESWRRYEQGELMTGEAGSDDRDGAEESSRQAERGRDAGTEEPGTATAAAADERGGDGPAADDEERVRSGRAAEEEEEAAEDDDPLKAEVLAEEELEPS